MDDNRAKLNDRLLKIKYDIYESDFFKSLFDVKPYTMPFILQYGKIVDDSHINFVITTRLYHKFTMNIEVCQSKRTVKNSPDLKNFADKYKCDYEKYLNMLKMIKILLSEYAPRWKCLDDVVDSKYYNKIYRGYSSFSERIKIKDLGITAEDCINHRIFPPKYDWDIMNKGYFTEAFPVFFKTICCSLTNIDALKKTRSVIEQKC